jgi:predicted dehydrogenase
MTPSLKLAIIGLGRWGTHLLRNFLVLPQAEVMAIADTHPQRLQEMRDKFQLSSKIQCFESGEAVLALPELDAVVIATPASTHARLIRLALEQALHILCEKPMTLDRASSEALCRLAAQHHRQLVVDHTYLFHPVVQRGYQFCQQTPENRWRYGYATRTNLGPVRQDVDVFWDLAIHDVSILNHWLEHPPLTVAAWGHIWLQPQAQSRFPSGLRDVGWMRLTYPPQIEVVIHVSWLNPDKQRRLALVGDHGTLVLDEMKPDAPLTWYPGQVISQGSNYCLALPSPIIVDTEGGEPLAQVAQHFLDCALDNSSSKVSSGTAAMDLVKLMEATQQAVETAQTVAL